MHVLQRYSEFEELHDTVDTLKRNLQVSQIHFLFLVWLPFRTWYSLLPSPPTLPPNAGFVFVQHFCVAVANYYNFGFASVCCILSWAGETTCGLGYWDEKNTRTLCRTLDVFQKFMALEPWSKPVGRWKERPTQYLYFTGSMLSSGIRVEWRG